MIYPFTYPVNDIKPGSLVMHERFPKVLWRVLGPATHAREPSFDVRNAEEATTRRYAGIHTFRVAELERVTDRCPKHKSYRGRTLPRSKCPGCWAVFDGRK